LKFDVRLEANEAKTLSSWVLFNCYITYYTFLPNQ